MDLKNTWNEERYLLFTKFLNEIKEADYQLFQKKLIFTNYEILGIRIPKLRSIAKDIFKGDYLSFLKVAKNETFEEVMIYLLIIAQIQNEKEFFDFFPACISLIDNWALCDTFCNSLKIVEKKKELFFNYIKELVSLKQTYYQRVGFVLLLNFYVEDHYVKEVKKLVESVQSDDYYVYMAQAWLVCEIFVKYESIGLAILSNKKINSYVRNIGIQKIRDSKRVTKEMKDFILRYKG